MQTKTDRQVMQTLVLLLPHIERSEKSDPDFSPENCIEDSEEINLIITPVEDRMFLA